MDLMPANIPTGPCSSCPYARATPPGIWEPHEYARLPAYDNETFNQPVQMFYCHHDNDNLCGGWLAAHDTEGLLSVRLGISMGFVDPSVMDFETDAPCWSSGQEAYERGAVDGLPDIDAQAAIVRIKRERSGRID